MANEYKQIFKLIPTREGNIAHALSSGHKKQENESKPACLEVPRLVDEDIFWLQVAVDDIERVEILERQDDLSGVECCVRLAAATETIPVSSEYRKQKAFGNRYNNC